MLRIQARPKAAKPSLHVVMGLIAQINVITQLRDEQLFELQNSKAVCGKRRLTTEERKKALQSFVDLLKESSQADPKSYDKLCAAFPEAAAIVEAHSEMINVQFDLLRAALKSNLRQPNASHSDRQDLTLWLQQLDDAQSKWTPPKLAGSSRKVAEDLADRSAAAHVQWSDLRAALERYPRLEWISALLDKASNSSGLWLGSVKATDPGFKSPIDALPQSGGEAFELEEAWQRLLQVVTYANEADGDGDCPFEAPIFGCVIQESYENWSRVAGEYLRKLDKPLRLKAALAFRLLMHRSVSTQLFPCEDDFFVVEALKKDAKEARKSRQAQIISGALHRMQARNLLGSKTERSRKILEPRDRDREMRQEAVKITAKTKARLSKNETPGWSFFDKLEELPEPVDHPVKKLRESAVLRSRRCRDPHSIELDHKRASQPSSKPSLRTPKDQQSRSVRNEPVKERAMPKASAEQKPASLRDVLGGALVTSSVKKEVAVVSHQQRPPRLICQIAEPFRLPDFGQKLEEVSKRSAAAVPRQQRSSRIPIPCAEPSQLAASPRQAAKSLDKSYVEARPSRIPISLPKPAKLRDYVAKADQLLGTASSRVVSGAQRSSRIPIPLSKVPELRDFVATRAEQYHAKKQSLAKPAKVVMTRDCVEKTVLCKSIEKNAEPNVKLDHSLTSEVQNRGGQKRYVSPLSTKAKDVKSEGTSVRARMNEYSQRLRQAVTKKSLGRASARRQSQDRPIRSHAS